ncbi:unnamed protein product, partial [Pylaiella littoralis]
LRKKKAPTTVVAKRKSIPAVRNGLIVVKISNIFLERHKKIVARGDIDLRRSLRIFFSRITAVVVPQPGRVSEGDKTRSGRKSHVEKVISLEQMKRNPGQSLFFFINYSRTVAVSFPLVQNERTESPSLPDPLLPHNVLYFEVPYSTQDTTP